MNRITDRRRSFRVDPGNDSATDTFRTSSLLGASKTYHLYYDHRADVVNDAAENPIIAAVFAV